MPSCCVDKSCEIEALNINQSSTLKKVLIINSVMFTVVVSAALYGKSSSLLADSFDNFGDALTYGLSMYAASRGALVKAKMALLKGVLIFLAAIIVIGQIIYKVIEPSVPIFEIMGVFSLLSLIANSICFYLLWRHRNEDINMSSVWECSRNDIVANISIFLAAGAVWLTNSIWPDIFVAFGLACLLLYSSFKVVSSATKNIQELKHSPK